VCVCSVDLNLLFFVLFIIGGGYSGDRGGYGAPRGGQGYSEGGYGGGGKYN